MRATAESLGFAHDVAVRVFDGVRATSERASDDVGTSEAMAVSETSNGCDFHDVSASRVGLFLLASTYGNARARTRRRGGNEPYVDATDVDDWWNAANEPTSPVTSPKRGQKIGSARSPTRSPTKGMMSERRRTERASDGFGVRASSARGAEGSFAGFLLNHWDTVVLACALDADARDGTTETMSGREVDALGFVFEARDGDGAIQPLSAFLFANAEKADERVDASAVRDWIARHLDSNGKSSSLRAEMSAVQAVAALAISSEADDDDEGATAVHEVNAKTMVTIDGAYKTTVVRQQGAGATRVASGASACCKSTPKNLATYGSPLYVSATPCAEVTSCSDSMIYLLEPYHYVSISGCSDCTIVVGACARSMLMEQCERVTLMCATKRIAVRSCFECTFHLAIVNQPIFIGDNRKCVLAPYNTYYEQLDEHLRHARIHAAQCTAWDRPVVLGADVTIKDQQSSGKHSSVVRISTGVSLMSPDAYMPFIVPFRESASASPRTAADALSSPTQANPFETPPSYVAALDAKMQRVNDVRTRVRDSSLSESKRSELQGAIQAHFKEWLASSGHSRQIFDLSALEREDMRAHASPSTSSVNTSRT